MIRLEELHKSYGGRIALAPLSLDVAAGEVVALVGPNGAGKSTTLRALAGVVRPSGGRAWIAGHDVVAQAAAARRQLGYLSQRPGVPLSTVVGDLLALVAGVRNVSWNEAIETLAAAGLDDRLQSALGELSGGQRQRVMLMIATLGPITALLLDEPSISLDTEGSEEVRLTIRRAREQGAAVLFASHHLHDVAVLADRILVMVQGRVIAQGTLPTLAEAAGVPWSGAEAADPPIERIYRALLARGSAVSERRLNLVRGDAA
ncbi:MAG: ABC transporter ATP-binding protein [Gemmatimonadales bacterium]